MGGLFFLVKPWVNVKKDKSVGKMVINIFIAFQIEGVIKHSIILTNDQ